MATNRVRVYIEDTATVLATYTSFRLYRATAPDGTFSLVSTTTIVSGTENYTVEDTAGSARSWYRVSFYNATGPVESEMGPPFQAQGSTLRDLRVEAAIQAGAGFAGTATGGTTTTLEDTALLDQGVHTDFMEGAWLYRPDAAAAGDRTRRVSRSGFSTTTGALSIPTARAYTNAPVNGEEYHSFALMPPVDQPGNPHSWDRAVREGLRRARFIDQVDLGPGDGTATEFSLAPHIGYLEPRSIRSVFLRTTDSNDVVHDQDASRNGLFWRLGGNGPEDLYVRLSQAPTTDETVIVEGVCSDAALYIDADTTRTPYDRALECIVYEAFRMLEAIQPGQYTSELAIAASKLRESDRRSGLGPVVRW